jgi:hypothetical protein
MLSQKQIEAAFAVSLKPGGRRQYWRPYRCLRQALEEIGAKRALNGCLPPPSRGALEHSNAVDGIGVPELFYFHLGPKRLTDVYSRNAVASSTPEACIAS